MREPMQALLGAIERDEGGIAVVWCPDMGLREWLVGEVESLVPTATQPFRASTVEEALVLPNRMALLIPDNEEEVVLDLDGSRDRLRNEENPRTQPIVLFLLRNGDGQRALAEKAISLASWISELRRARTTRVRAIEPKWSGSTNCAIVYDRCTRDRP